MKGLPLHSVFIRRSRTVRALQTLVALLFMPWLHRKASDIQARGKPATGSRYTTKMEHRRRVMALKALGEFKKGRFGMHRSKTTKQVRSTGARRRALRSIST